jgi:5'-3' exonuclease
MSFNFNELVEPESNKTLVVDALNLAFRWKHQGRSDFRHEFVATVESLAKSYKCERIIITADKGSSDYRKRILPSYKQNRKDKYSKQTEEEALSFKEFILEYEQSLFLLKDKYTLLQVQGVEADDIAAYLVKYKDKFEIGDIVLVSSDKDWDLLIQEGVMRFSYVTRKEVTLENWSDHYNIPREQYACFKCLVGDKGDNVPGISGIGPKRAQQLLEEYGSAYDIYDSLPIDSSYKHIQALNASEDLILRNYELMDLLTHCEDAIDFNYGREELDRRMQ